MAPRGATGTSSAADGAVGRAGRRAMTGGRRPDVRRAIVAANVARRDDEGRALALAAIGVMAVGAALRLLEYADRRPLWMDELMLSLNIAMRSFAGLTRPLYLTQSAPLGFLWSQRAAVIAGGVSEWTLRALPLLFGLATLPLLWAAGRRLVGPRGALIALLLAALSHPLLYYASEAKQYAGDACATALLLYVGARVLETPDDARRWRWLTVAGLAAIAFSQPSVFVLAAMGAALPLSPRVRASPRWLSRLAGAAALWVTLFATLYFTVYRAAATSRYMQQVWRDAFVTPGAPDFAARLRDAATYVLLQSSLPSWTTPGRAALWGATAAFASGVAALWWRPERRGGAALVTLPFAIVLAASAARQYPAAVRLLVFLAPLVFVVYGAAVAAVVDAIPRARPHWRNATYVAAFAALTLWRFDGARRQALDPRRYEDTRDVVAEYERAHSVDPVYVFSDGVPSWAFYTTRWSAPDTARLTWLLLDTRPPGAGPADVSPEAAAVVARPRPRGPGGPVELRGTPPGMEWRERKGMLEPRPAAGWADAEARRIRDVAMGGPRPSYFAWVYFAHFGGVERDELLAALSRIGGHVVFGRERDTVVLYRVRFDDGDAPPAPSRG